VDDEQVPWWTRPPEPGTQAPPVQRRRTSEPDVERAHPQGDYPSTEPGAADTAVQHAPPGYAPTEYPQPEYSQAEYPQAEYPQAGYTPPEFAPTEYLQPQQIPTGHTATEPVADAQPPAGYVPDEPTVTEPAPVPKPVIRRVAVVPPAAPAATDGPAARTSANERTETLPAVSDEIFATFGGPPKAGGPGAGGSGFGLSKGSTGPSTSGSAKDEPEAGPSGPWQDGPLQRLVHAKLPEPRVLLLAGAGALVVLLIVLVALISGHGKKAEPTARPSAAPSGAGATALKGKQPDGLTKVSDGEAATQLQAAGQNNGGSIVEAWGWDDKNGRNLVVTSTAAAGANKRTLRVIHIANLDDKPRRLRLMKDPNLPADCGGAGTAQFTPNSLTVVDLNGDDVAEVISGWSSRCGGKDAQSQIKLALITDGDKYILRGQGVLGQAGADSFTPAPRAKSWPNGYLKALSAEYLRLYQR
jgi:hypothetical protein